MEKQEQSNQRKHRKDIRRRTEINEIENRNTIEEIIETKPGFLKILIKLARPTKEKKKEDTNCQYQEWNERYQYISYRYHNNNKGIVKIIIPIGLTS